jgi:hypothetical protein
MGSALPLRAALMRGALVTAANWPVVLVEFSLEMLYKLALAVPVVGGAFMVAVLLGADLRAIFADGLRTAADLILSSLESAPVALGAFLGAVTMVALGGGLVLFAVKAGTLWTLVAGERAAGEMPRGAWPLAAVRRARAYDTASLVAAARRFAGRAATLTLWLSLAYAAVAGAYVGVLAWAVRLTAHPSWSSLWPVVVLLATSAGVVAVTSVNLAFDLLRVIVVTDDCGVRTAWGRLRVFLLEDARRVLGIFAVVEIVLMLAVAVSVLATAALALVAWVPVAGAMALPLRAAAWLLQGLLIQYVGLCALSAYQTQYRRFAGAESRPERPAFHVEHA